MRRIALCLLLALAACDGNPSDNQPPPGDVALRLRQVVGGLQSPVHLVAPTGDARLFVVEQGGRIRVVENGALLATPFLDIASRVSSGGERGLLSMAFHPQYASNGFFFVNYTDVNGDTRVERYRVSADRNRADPASAQLVIAIDQPASNHNGGLVAFGPDGRLYVGMGDGGGAGDPLGAAQDPTQLLGKMLRLDVNGAAPYTIPADNPYAGRTDGRAEIWASGLRNPWRFSWDRAESRLYVADVGQNRLEEVDVVPAAQAGVNYGWDTMEGSDCFEPRDGCTRTGLTLPAAEYTHADGCSITGGFVYRGQDIPALRGTYFYSDYCEGWLRSFRYVNGAATDPRTWEVPNVGNVTSFGEDGRGELYLIASGAVYRIEAAA
ncbi:PQQ-dependent sugar dehydrogenase [Longimicrobium sp.]|uniref:PQQ-dependent sugar dehydrogenase n=1 Tax=Longimicrobium sp. TaxID=2029185 RepID=UPI002E363718|nr:PQQ-dependent sugar dehydrogenase [Longimicrobium sp.]HEX6041681.1 PQQ-dependent sugar dehydrogenase [Longimicrobium sp.]